MERAHNFSSRSFLLRCHACDFSMWSEFSSVLGTDCYDASSVSNSSTVDRKECVYVLLLLLFFISPKEGILTLLSRLKSEVSPHTTIKFSPNQYARARSEAQRTLPDVRPINKVLQFVGI